MPTTPAPENLSQKISQGKELRTGFLKKGYRDHPLIDEQKERGRNRSKIRARVEHVFGFTTGSMHGIAVRSMEIKRARFNFGLTNLLYNKCRYGFPVHFRQRMPGEYSCKKDASLVVFPYAVNCFLKFDGFERLPIDSNLPCRCPCFILLENGFFPPDAAAGGGERNADETGQGVI